MRAAGRPVVKTGLARGGREPGLQRPLNGLVPLAERNFEVPGRGSRHACLYCQCWESHSHHPKPLEPPNCFYGFPP